MRRNDMTVPLVAGATLRLLELPARADAAPSPLIRAYAAVRNASLAEETGRADDAVTAETMLPLLYSDADVARTQWYIERAGEVIGCVPLNVYQDDDAATAMGTIALLREHWGQGIGSAALAHVEQFARAQGLRKLLCWNEHHDRDAVGTIPSPTGFGTVPNDHAARFLQRHGFSLEQIERASTLAWDPTTRRRLQGLHADAVAHATGYRIVQWMLPTPEEFIDGYAWLKSRMSTDVPDAELGMPIETWDADRVRRHDARYAGKGETVQVTAAEHIATGELCAFNELVIDQHPTSKTDQRDTLVLSGHRGHRLGMLVKTAGLLSWRAQHPDSPHVMTYNAEENRPMLSINEAIRFAPIAYEGAWKKVLR